MLKTIRHLYPSLTALAALGAAILFLGGCHHRSVDDDLAAGDSAMQTNQLGEAESDYNEAIKAAPNDPRTHIALGNLYIFEHKTAQAQAEFMKVLDLDPKNAATHVALGNLYMDQSQYPLAENQYRAAVALEPERPAYHLDLSQALIKQNKLDAAEDQIRTALGLDPKNAQAHYALANLLNTIPNRQAEAQTEYEQARALDPKLTGPAPENAESTPEAAATVAPAAAPSAAPSEAAAMTPAAAPSPPMPAMPTAAAAAPVKIKPLNKLFLLTKNSPVYQNPDNASAVVAQVRANKYVHVTGIAGNYLQVRLRTGTVGFIPIAAAE
ncbi:MAG TPA: tetratricopeptide repeat protein [Candidatus Binataceae bacterium]|nr:tetratricopeptide repeat protein [Candidatus Binataceae bacterium]